MLERWPQVCHVKITFTLLLTSRLVSTTIHSMKCIVNWIPLKIRFCCGNTTPSSSLLYISTSGTYSKFARKNIFLALGVCFTQPCPSAGRKFAASRSRLQNYQRIVWFQRQKIRWNALSGFQFGFHWESAFGREIPNPTSTDKFWFFLQAKHFFFRKLPLSSGSLFASTQKVHRPRS